MKAVWYLVDKETLEVVGTATLEGDWSKEDFRNSVTDLCAHYSQPEYLVPDFKYDSLIGSKKDE